MCVWRHPAGKSPAHLNECLLVISFTPPPPACRFQAAGHTHLPNPDKSYVQNLSGSILSPPLANSCSTPLFPSGSLLLPSMSSSTSPSPPLQLPGLIPYLSPAPASRMPAFPGASTHDSTFFLGKPLLTALAALFFPMNFTIKQLNSCKRKKLKTVGMFAGIM